MRALQAYYDLKVSPVTFDIFEFLYLAEIERVARNIDDFELFVVANTGDGFRDAAADPPLETKKWHLRHIVLPAGNLLPACRRSLYLPSREEAAANFDYDAAVFPAGYTVDEPVANYDASGVVMALHAGKQLGSLDAPAIAVDHMRHWLASHTNGAHPIVITLRDGSFQALRNSNLDEWLRFAGSLDPDKYQPVFVPETSTVFAGSFETVTEFPVCEEAAIDIELRMALYQAAYLNLFVDSGPATLCGLNQATRSIRFKMISGKDPSAGPALYHGLGYEPGMQYANHTSVQRTVWEDDTFETISRAFEDMVAHIESEEDPVRAPLPPVIETISRFVVGENYAHAIELCEAALRVEPSNLEAKFLLASSYQMTERIDEAVAIYEPLREVSGDQNFIILPLAKRLIERDEIETARDLLRVVIEQAGDDTQTAIDACITMFQIGLDDEAAGILEAIFAADPTDYDTVVNLAQYYHIDNITIPKAIECYRRAIALKPERKAALSLSLADCYARHARYGEAADMMERALAEAATISPEQLLRLAIVQRNAGQDKEARTNLMRLLKLVEDEIELRRTDGRPFDSAASMRATLLVSLDRPKEAHDAFRELSELRPTVSFNYEPALYLPDTPKRLERLCDLIAERDVFIFGHGLSIAAMDIWWDKFKDSDACLGAVNRFRVFETGFLAGSKRHLNIVMTSNYRGIRAHMDHFSEFLERDEDNLLITARWALDRLDDSCPTRRDLESRFDAKLLYCGGVGGWRPPTPDDPLTFPFGNTLSVTIAFAMLGHARRKFLFGADGGIVPDTDGDTHYGAGTEEFRYDVSGDQRDASMSSLKADADTFNATTDTSMLAIEALFGVARPPIYNVSPNSAYTLFPRIDYDAAWDMLNNPRA